MENRLHNPENYFCLIIFGLRWIIPENFSKIGQIMPWKPDPGSGILFGQKPPLDKNGTNFKKNSRICTAAP